MLRLGLYPVLPAERYFLGELIASLSDRQHFSLFIGVSCIKRGLDADVPSLGFTFEAPISEESSTSPRMISDIVYRFTNRGLPCYYVGMTPCVDPEFVTHHFEITFLS